MKTESITAADAGDKPLPGAKWGAVPMRQLRLLAWAALVAACAPASPPPNPPPGPANSPSHDAVVEVANALFAAMEARDTLTLRRIFMPEAQLVSIRLRNGMDPVIRSGGVADFISSVAQSPEALRERMWHPRVVVDGDFASLWAPYDFHLAEIFSHCGVDAFHLVRLGAEWKIAALSYTVQTSSCPPPPTER